MPAPWSGGALVRIVGKIQQQDCINTLHFATNTVVNDPIDWEPLLVALAAAVLACVVEQLLPAVTEDYEVDHVEAIRIHPDHSDPVFATAGAERLGQLGPASVSFAASLVNIRSTRGGRRGHGKLFLAPPGEADTTGSKISAQTMAAITQFLLCLAGKFTGANPTTEWRLGVFSQTQFKQLVGGGFDNAFAPVTQMSPSATLAVISSRKIGHGN